MDKYVGNWKLEKNINFDDFLKYYQFSWMKRNMALLSNIDITIEKINETTIKRNIESTFYTKEEIYYIDGIERKGNPNPEGKIFHRTHYLKDDCFMSKITNKIDIDFIDKCYIQDSKLIVDKIWEENGIKKESRQIYCRKND